MCRIKKNGMANLQHYASFKAASLVCFFLLFVPVYLRASEDLVVWLSLSTVKPFCNTEVMLAFQTHTTLVNTYRM